MKMSPKITQEPLSPERSGYEVDNTQGSAGVLRKFGNGVSANEPANDEKFERSFTGRGSKIITPELFERLDRFGLSQEEMVIITRFINYDRNNKGVGKFLTESNGQFKINAETFGLFTLSMLGVEVFIGRNISYTSIYESLNKCGAFDGSEISSAVDFKKIIGKDVESKKILVEISNPPESLNELISGKENSANQKISSFEQDSDIILADGTVTNAVEIQVARFLKEEGVGRNKSGKLVFLKGKNEGKPFIMEGKVNVIVALMTRLRNRKKIGDESVDSTLVTILPRFCNNLLDAGIIKMSDFNLYSTEANYTYISKAMGSSFQVMLPTQDGKLTAQYYIGRNVYSGTERKIDRDSSVIRVLDYKTGGIFEKSGLSDDLHLLYTFPLQSTELVEARKKIQQEKVETGINSQAVVTIGAKEMQLTPYKAKESNTDAIFNMRYELLRLGIYSTTIPWEEQVSLYGALAGGGGRSERIKKFAKSFGENGIKSFLAYEKNPSVSKVIYELSEKNPELAKQVFSKIAQIVDQINHIDLFLENTFGKETSLNNVRARVRSSLLGKATSVLEAVSGDSYSEVDTLEKLGTINTQTLLFASSFKSLIESGFDISLEDIANAELITHTGNTLSREDYGLMFDMYKKNQGANSDINQELILKNFSNAAENSNARFHMFKWNNKLQGFVVFQDDKNGFAKGSAFNIDPETHGYKLGEAILTQVIKREAEVKPLIADVLAMNTIVPKYLDTGWVATRFFIDNNDPVLDIIQDSKSNEIYWGKHATKEAIMSLVAPQKSGRENVVIEIANSQKDLIEKYKHHFEKGLCLTRIIRNDSGDMYYGVFEPFLKPEPKKEKTLDTDSEKPTEELLTA